MTSGDLAGRIRPELARPTPYRWQEGIPEGPVDRFDMNTPADPPAWWAASLARLAAIPPNDYPDASYLPLKSAIGTYVGLPASQVVVGAGCDEIIGLVALLALGPGRRALLCRPTYQLYSVASRNVGASVEALEPRAGLRPDTDKLVERAREAQLVWVCSPNNPTGDETPAATVASLCQECPGLVVVDQAYLELGGDDHAALVADHANLLVTRTFSKGFGLGAARVGYGLAQPDLAAALDALRPPGSIASWSEAAARLACAEADEMRGRCAAIVAERDRLAARLAGAGLRVDAAAGNFLLVRAPVADVFARLAERGLIVRTFGHEPLLADHVRITVGHPAANERLTAALAELAGGHAPPAASPPASGRTAARRRATRETRIAIDLRLDGGGRSRISTGIGFLDHMLTSLAFWSLIDIELRCSGDLWIDDHHTVEDCAITLGEALDEALGDRAGLCRFGNARAPLDEAHAEATIDLSGRGVAVLDIALRGAAIGRLPTSLVPHFFDTLARRGRLGLHLQAAGDDDHHVVEAAFKATALALRTAVAVDPRRGGIASTKGAL